MFRPSSRGDSAVHAGWMERTGRAWVPWRDRDTVRPGYLRLKGYKTCVPVVRADAHEREMYARHGARGSAPGVARARRRLPPGRSGRLESRCSGRTRLARAARERLGHDDPARRSGLADNTGYHWQARAVDQSGPIGTWRTYGGNPESAADVHFDVVATHLAFTSPPATTTAGATLPPVQVALVDAQNNTVTTFTGTITLTLLNAGGAVLGGSTDMSAVSGVATFSDLSITQAGSGYRLEATSDTLSGVTSGSFAINPGPADHLVFLVEPSNTKPNEAITPAVRVAVHDVYSNVVTSFTDVMFMNIGNDGSLLKNATLDPAGTHRAASAGIATFEDLRIDQLGSGYTLAVSAAGTRGATSGRFDVTLTP